MNKIRRYLLLGMVLFLAILMSTTLVVTAQVPDEQPVDETLGNPPTEKTAPQGAPVPAGGTLALLDDFNRADGPIGPNWTVHDGYCNVVSNAAACGSIGRATFISAPGTGDFAEADVAVVGTDLQYTGLLLNYGAGVNNVFIKVQQQDPYPGQFTHGACYIGNQGGSFGLGFFSLNSFFSTAHMAVERVGNTVTIYFTNVDGGGQPDQTYVCDGAPAPEGTGIGINGYNGIALLDNFGGPGAPGPDIQVDPLEMHAVLPPDWQETQVLTICNVGDAELAWEIIEVPTILDGSMPFVPVSVEGSNGTPVGMSVSSNPAQLGTPSPPANPQAVLWDQPLSVVNQGAYVNQEFPDFPTFSSFLADDFTNSDPWTIESIFIPGDGWNGFSTLMNASALTWQIYADNAGVPDGDPSGGGNPPVWTLTLAPSDPQVVITNGTPGGYPSNTQLYPTVPIDLPPGTWWLVFYPTMDFGVYGQYGRQPSDTTNGYYGQFINPGGGFGYGTVWQNWTVIGPTQQDIAFRLEGEINLGIPWVSEDPIAGSTPAGGCTPVDVTFDSTGLAFGDYFGNLEINSNDPDEPTVVVPLQLTVVPWVTWDKYINGEPWYPDMEITVQTSDTIIVQEVLHLLQPNWLAVGATTPVQTQPTVEADHVIPSQMPETTSGVQPSLPTLPATQPKTLQNPGLLYLTSLDTYDPTFAVYDPALDSWTTLTPYETGAQMAVSAWGQLYAFGFATGTIDVYDPATDTWTPVNTAPPGATGSQGNLEITVAGEFLYTEWQATTLWYTVGGVWNTMALPFTGNAMGDYDPTTDQYVVGEAWTTNAHMIDVHTFAITDFSSPVGNGENARFSVVMDNRYYFEAGGSNIHYFDLNNPAAPPVDTSLNWGWYSSAAGDRANHVIFNVELDSTDMMLFDTIANTLSPLTGYGISAWHSSVAYVTVGEVEPAPVFAQIETWDPAHLMLLDWAATYGEVIVYPDSVIWTGEILESTTVTLTKWFHVEPSSWTQTILWEELWLDDTELEQRPVIINKLPPELWIDAAYDPLVYAGQQANFTLSYGNTGGYENDVMIRNDFPTEAPFDSAEPPPDRQDPDGLWAEWDVGDLPMGAQGSISVWVNIQPDVPGQTIIEIWDGIYNHMDELVDEVFIEFEVLPTVDLGVTKNAPADVFVGDTFTYTVIVTNYGLDDAAGITLEDTLPVSVTYVSDNLGCNYALGVLTCDIASLAADASATLYIIVTANAAGSVTNFAEVWSADYDPDPENNEASAGTLISELPVVDLELVKEAPAEVLVGDTFTYTVYVTNYGPDHVYGVTIEDTLPANVTYFSDNLGCTHASGVVTCTIDFLAVDESVALYIVVTADSAGTVTNSAEVWSAEYDPDTSNNADSADTVISEGVFYYFVPVTYKH